MVREGHYGLKPSLSGKYFFFTENAMRDFANSPDNSRIIALTEVEVPNSFIEQGDLLNVFGEGESIHFTDEQLLDLYDHIDLPNIIDSRGIPILGGGG